MSSFHFDPYATFFTPQEFPVEILNIAKNHDVVACCLQPPAKNFLAFMLFKEFYYQSNGISVYIHEEPEPGMGGEGHDHHITKDLPPSQGNRRPSSSSATKKSSKFHLFPFEALSSIPTFHVKDGAEYKGKVIPDSAVLICSRQAFLDLISEESLHFNKTLLEHLNLVVISNVHEALTCFKVRICLRKILRKVRSWNSQRETASEKPRIRTVFLTLSLLHFYGNEANGFWRMEETFRKLAKFCDAKVDTTSDIVSLLQYSSPPTERIILVGPHLHSDVSVKLIREVKGMIECFKQFLNCHNFNPAASLGYTLNEFQELIKEKLPDVVPADEAAEEERDADVDSLAEELRRIPHPKTAPLELLREFEEILDSMGPWCASRAIFMLNNKLAGLKVQVPYVRHFLLLGALHTRFLWIQSIFHEAFDELEPLEVLENFSTPKLMGVLQILRRFDLSKPHESKNGQAEELEEDEDSDAEFTVADYLEQQKQVEQQAVAARGGRFHGRRKHYRAKFDVDRQKRDMSANPPASEDIDAKTEDSLATETVILSTPQPPPPAGEGEDDIPEKLEGAHLKTGAVETLKNEALVERNSPQPSPSTTRYQRRNKYANRSEDALCGLLICEDRCAARLLYHFLIEAAEADPKLMGLCPTITVPSNPEYDKESPEAEVEHKKREESLRKFRYREANFLIGTSLLEDGIELPKANLVIRYDEATSFRSYLLSKGRAQGYDPEYYIFTGELDPSNCLRQLSTYKIVEEMLQAHTVIPTSLLPSESTAAAELSWTAGFPQYKCAKLSNSISIVNRYCARLPSDSFTRLTPSWKVNQTGNCSNPYLCTLRLPINSPVKWPINGIPMPTEGLAKKAVAFQAVVVLHKNGELDDGLMPIGKEGVLAVPDLDIGGDVLDETYGEFRPGSTRRRQYYDKQLSPELIHCLPRPTETLYLYWLKMVLTCPLPDDQNTRGRMLHPPQVASQAFGVLLTKEVPPIPPFPIYTRCGEVHVELVMVTGDERLADLSPSEFKKLSTFHHYTFTSVLRLDKYLTLFDPEASENSYFVVPLRATGQSSIDGTIDSVQLDWDFIEQIYKEKDTLRPAPVSNLERKDYKFQREKYVDAVVTPWYRNNDQPQFFYVAEICANLTPMSQFPGCEFKTFEEYYNRKYNLSIHDPQQPLLDVDHTSARLNFLTPRYVNRKGLPLPTSSEATKRAKRENLEQKQILIPELCAIHPFSGSLWRQAVCLPCILYRVNCLLVANSIRSLVASQVHGLGMIRVPVGFQWETMSFGWSLQELFGVDAFKQTPKTKPSLLPKKDPVVVREEDKDAASAMPEEKQLNGDVYPIIVLPPGESDFTEAQTPKAEGASAGKKKAGEPKEKKKEERELSGFEKAAKEATPAGVTLAESLLLNDKKHVGKSVNEILSEKMKKCRQPELEIGTWSNEMASGNSGTFSEPEYDEDEDDEDPDVALPSNLMMLDKNWTWGGRSKLFNHHVHRALYGSPTHWGEVWDRGAFEPPEDSENSKRSGGGVDDDNLSVTSDMSGGSDESFIDGDNNLKIQFQGNTAEAMDKRKAGKTFDLQTVDDWTTSEDSWWPMDGVDDERCDVTGNGQLEEDEDECQLNTTFEMEEALRSEFERRVDKGINGIQQIVNWDQISNLPPRAPKKHFVNEESATSCDDLAPPEESKKLQELLRKTALRPPPEVTEGSSEGTCGIAQAQRNIPTDFSFDYNPPLGTHCGPNPCKILQALTMSNANDGQNLERLETVGDSFLKYAITSYLFSTYETIHEGKLSHLRSKQVSNVHLYRLGRRRGLGGVMISAKFEPHDNWLPPCYHIPKDLDKAFIQSQAELGTSNFSMAQVNALKGLSSSEIEHALKHNTIKADTEYIPYNLVTQQSIPDKSIADGVEALIGAYLTSAGPHGALLFMSWLGMRVLPSKVIKREELPANKSSLFYMGVPPTENVIVFDVLKPPKSPLLKYTPNYEQHLLNLLKGYEKFEEYIGYTFRDKSYLLQAFTHASYATNTLTDCYQRLEFLGDAILDYVITRHLYEDKRQHSPGSLTDLRSALVNNTIFASLAVKHGFHLYFRHSSPGLTAVLQKFVVFQEEHGHILTPDYYYMGEEECDEAEDIEVPKALGDVFESVAGAIFLDSGMSLDAVWRVYYKIMKEEIEQFSQNVPKSPIRELLELEPETAKFGKPEKLWDGRRVRVSVEIIGVGVFRGIGRNYRIAKCTAAKCALRHLRRLTFTKKASH